MSSFVDDYFSALFEWSPTFGTSVGLHQYDLKIEDLSATAFNRRIEQLKELQRRLTGIRNIEMKPDDQIDAEILSGQIQAELLDLETLRTWRKNPMNYVGLPGSAIDGLIKRKFAPASDRLRSVIARLKGVPPLLEAMRQNIENPPHEFTDLAMRIAQGSVSFFKETIASWAKDAAGPDAVLFHEFEEANGAAAKSLEDAAGWLETTLLPNSRGIYAIGAENFAKKLLYEEMVDTPLDRLLAVGEANLARDYSDFIETARKIDSSKSPAAVMHSISNEHPTAEDLVRVHYTGWKTDGSMFDSSVASGKPAVFPVNRVIAGFSEGLKLMVPGEKRRLWIPESLAYKGAREPKGMLVFDVELVDMPNRPPPDVKAPPSEAKKTASGLAYKILAQGVGGRHPKPGSQVTVHYTGWTTDGKMFESSIVSGQPATFPVNGVIPGWTEGLQLMVEGEKIRFWIPQNLAYKGQSAPYGMLVFDVALIKIADSK